jgi:hypothetical protein
MSISPLFLYIAAFGAVGFVVAINSFSRDPVTALIMILICMFPISPSVWWFVSAFLFRNHYAATQYEFFSNRMVYTIGFTGITSGEILYRDVNEINLIQGFPRSLFGLGAIEIVTAKPIEFIPGIDKKPVLYLFDIANAEQNYRKIRTLVFGEQDERPST